MIDIINSAKWYTSPTMYWTIQYEHKRSGANMQYRFYWKVWVNSGSWYDDGLQLQLFLDGTQHNVTVKSWQTDNKGWSYEGTTDWYTVQNKTSGTTSFYARIYDTNTSSVKVTSGTYSLAVIGAPSVLGAVANFKIGESISLTITKYDSSYVDTLSIYCGTTLVKKIAGVGKNVVVEFSGSELDIIYSACPNTRTAEFRFLLQTTSGSTVVGGYSRTATGTIVDAYPIFTASQVTYEDTNSKAYNITGNKQHIVQNKSTLRVTFTNATGNKGATITQYTVTVNGVTKTATAGGFLDFGTVNTSQNTEIVVIVEDSRGLATKVRKTVTILPYSTPTMAVTLERLNNYEDETYLTVKASISSVNSKNSATISYKKKLSGGSYGSSTTLTNNTKYTMSCDKESAYIFSVTVADKFESVTAEYVLPRGRFPLFIDTGKNAVGINEFPSSGEALRVAGGVACFDGGIVLKSASYSWLLSVTDSGALSITKM